MPGLDQPLPLAQELIRCQSVTPADGGALDVLQRALQSLGFRCTRLPFTEPGTPDIDNLYARLGDVAPNFCFAGHSDVVPVGDATRWSVDPFGASVSGGALFGRGAADMKGAIAAFVAAVSRVKDDGKVTGSISLLITGDEEGPSINGTKKMLRALVERGEKLDACLVGEPTNPTKLGEMIKIGRRGSLSGWLTVTGVQGHTAYPHLADSPIPRLLRMLRVMSETALDDGTAHFQPSNLQITTVDIGNPATNVIPGEARAAFNIRFNDRHSGKSLEDWLRREFDAIGGAYELRIQVSGEAFLTPPGPLSSLIARAVKAITGLEPELSTTGGTSDARFIKDYCPVAEFGLAGQTMHKVDERVSLADLEALTRIYQGVIEGFFAGR